MVCIEVFKEGDDVLISAWKRQSSHPQCSIIIHLDYQVWIIGVLTICVVCLSGLRRRRFLIATSSPWRASIIACTSNLGLALLLLSFDVFKSYLVSFLSWSRKKAISLKWSHAHHNHSILGINSMLLNHKWSP
jgi:hypothetical protein